MALAFEVFSAGGAPPEAVWAVVGNPRRLPEWTDAEAVEEVAPEPVEVGTEIVTRQGDQVLRWKVVTFGSRTIEVVADTPRGRLGLGARVARDPLGSRIVLAGALQPASSRLRARLLDLPALRRRFDRWSRDAFAAAQASAARDPAAPSPAPHDPARDAEQGH